ncbi:pyridoxal phosphate-dependent aminotransferase [Terricaulis sp.]|uniref:pyridoxal phosphate-dependent aminotransferase n=1 Tax=Terricaulis sp. TaxID=2768686 RepID=UPI00378487BD
MSFRPAARIADIAVSEILQIGARAAAAKRAGRDVIVLGAGEPDFDTPDHIKRAAAEAMAKGATKYTALDGTPELKAAIVAKFKRENAMVVASNQVTVASGAKQIIFNAMMASLNPGDEVIVPAPYWVSYLDIIEICGAKAVVVDTAETEGFRLRPEALERAISSKTRWVMLNSPSNPTGAAHTRESLGALLSVLKHHSHVWVMADDIYEHILYDDRTFYTPAALDPEIAERTLTLNGVSKAYAMTGWRIGYAAGPQALIDAMAVVQSQSTSCPSSIGQAASVAALNGDQSFLRDRCASFQARRDFIVSAFNDIDGLRCPRPDGAFYVFANCEGVLERSKRVSTDRELANILLDEFDVAVTPGTAFGKPGFFRASYAASVAELERGCTRIAKACEALAKS